MQVLAIIPARGGSKGIPGKNLRLLDGVPLVALTIAAARNARRVNRVVVSTDDPEIARVAREAGAESVMRPPAISGDQASSEAALLHVLEQLQKSEGYDPELTVFMQCTSPFTTGEDVDGAIEALVEGNADTALSVTSFHGFLWRRGDDGAAVEIHHDRRVRPMRQAREPQYLETGAIYVLRTSGFRSARHRFFGKTVFFTVPAGRAIEIDEPDDLRLAELLLEDRRRAEAGALLPHPVGALVLDFDGVLTDNRVMVSESGEETVACDRSDGLGLARLGRDHVPMLVISSEANPTVQARCRKLGLPCLQGVDDKRAALEEWLGRAGIPPAQVIYVGNDVNDVECLRWVGCGVVVADAHPAARAAARLVLDRRGGRGAVREIVDLILRKREG